MQRAGIQHCLKALRTGDPNGGRRLHLNIECFTALTLLNSGESRFKNAYRDEFSFPSIQPTKLNMIKLEIHFIGAGKVPVSM